MMPRGIAIHPDGSVTIAGQVTASDETRETGFIARGSGDTWSTETIGEPGQRHWELLGVTAVGLAAPENIAFRYQLEGEERGWVDNGTVRFVRYTRIRPGHYRFRVTACNQDGIWNETGASVAITVQPYLWQATWFIVATAIATSCLLGGGLILAVRRRYRRRLERLEQQQALERERTRIAQDLHDVRGALKELI